MYWMTEKEDTVRIPPDLLGENFLELLEELTHQNFEGKIDADNYLTVLTTDIEPIGDGRIVHGDGGIYQRIKYNALLFKPEINEVIHGTVCEILKFGAFIRFGPLDGLLHISQIMDDHISPDIANERLIGKEKKRELRVGDQVRARVVAVSINERNPRESKIGLTMRQVGLGKVPWIIEDRDKSDKNAPPPDEGKRGGKKKKKRA